MATAKTTHSEKPTQVKKGGKEMAEQQETTPEEGTVGDIDMQIPESLELVKHPLQNRWSMWFFKNDKAKSWADNLRVITAFDTVEDFWALYNHIVVASRLQSGCDYALFKDGVKPMWEDDKNKTGGRWLVSFDKKSKPTEIDRCWLETLLLMVGEAFDEESDIVNGAVINVRSRGNKIAIWTGEARKEDKVCKVGKKFKERLNLPPRFSIPFEAHADTMTKHGSTAKHRFTV